MKKATGRILKSNDVVLEGRFNLGSSQNAPVHNHAKTIVAEPQVKIVDSQNDYALISITCPCGTQTIIRCEYAQRESQN
jgi:hypothetical protein